MYNNNNLPLLDKEEWEFFDKYEISLSDTRIWSFSRIPKEYRTQFYEFLHSVHCYYELRYNHHEDLIMYAKMFRNINLYSLFPEDILFFANKKNEIIGFRNRVLSNPNDLKYNILGLYFKYGLFFEGYCIKKHGIMISQRPPLGSKVTKWSYESIVKAKADDYEKFFSVNDLTEQQCEMLLRDACELKTAYKFHSVSPRNNIFYDKDYSGYSFVENVLLPYYRDSQSSRSWFLQSFVKRHFKSIEGLNLSNELQIQIKNIINIKVNQEEKEVINRLETEIAALKIKMPKSKSATPTRTAPVSIANKSGVYEHTKSNQQKIMNSEDDINDQIAALNKQIKNITDSVELRKYKLTKDLTAIIFDNSVEWSYLHSHQHELQDFSNYIYTIVYNRLIDHPIKGQQQWAEAMPYSAYIERVCEAYFHNEGELPISKHTFTTVEESKIGFYIRNYLPSWTDCVRTYMDPHREERIERERIMIEKKKLEEEKRQEFFRFNLRNTHPQDRKISFNPINHIYSVDGVCLDSVTTFVTNCFPRFNAELYAKRKAERLGVDYKEILCEWDKIGIESREQGTIMHKKIEDYYLGTISSDDDTFRLFRMFADQIQLKPYRTEWAVFDWKNKIAGTIDLVDCQDEEYIIYDWKRSDKLISRNGLPIKKNQYGEKALSPIEHLDNSPYYHYALQLSLYKYILERNYNIKVSKLRLGVFHPTYNKPYILEIPYLQKEIDTLFDIRSEVIF